VLARSALTISTGGRLGAVGATGPILEKIVAR